MVNLDPKLNYQKPGEEPYVFVSYAHKDREQVLPIIERLDREGFRRWYDSGIGYTEEWLDVIAERVKKCTVFLSIMTQKSAASKNCRREVYLADKYNKDLFFVFLDDPDTMVLPDGLEMIVTPPQYLNRNDTHRCPTEEDFLKEICESKCMQKCRKPAEEPPVTKVKVSGIVYDPKEFQIDGTTLVKVLHPGETVVVPDGVKTIGQYAISECLALRSIILPSGLSIIKDFTFSNCKRLSVIKLPQGIQYIGHWAFYDCPNLTIHMSRHTDTSKFAEDWNPDNRPIEYYD